ncbi:MAG: hypothetical protein HRT73_05655 [Flavobacteriales bacterium]|nr:hypothetical protein [Flavobacteriales bacterium]
MPNEEKIESVFNDFITGCSREDLNFIASHELNDREIIKLLNGKNDETKQEILDNFNVKY